MPAGLAALLDEVAAGRPPPADMAVTVLPRPPGKAAVIVLGLTAHHVVAADVDPDWVRASVPPGSLSARMGPAFLTALADRVGAEPGGQDVVLLAPARQSAPALPLQPASPAGHPRLERAMRYRDDVRAWQADGALLILGRGVAARWEVSVEVEPAYQGHGLGRRLAAAAPGLVPAGATLWAQMHPSNVSSLRAFLAAGYRPAGAEVLFTARAANGGGAGSNGS